MLENKINNNKMKCNKMNFDKLKKDIQNCSYCKNLFGFDPHPIFWGKQNSKIVQISQAPSKSVHESMKPFTDASGRTLKYEWYQITDNDFYDEDNFFIGAMAHCYPGKDSKGNDRKPPKCCFNNWVEKELKILDNQIYIIIGATAAKTFFPNDNFEDLVFKNNIWNEKLTIVLPHPSPLNRRWIKSHPDFILKRLPEVRKIIKNIIN